MGTVYVPAREVPAVPFVDEIVGPAPEIEVPDRPAGTLRARLERGRLAFPFLLAGDRGQVEAAELARRFDTEQSGVLLRVSRELRVLQFKGNVARLEALQDAVSFPSVVEDILVADGEVVVEIGERFAVLPDVHLDLLADVPCNGKLLVLLHGHVWRAGKPVGRRARAAFGPFAGHVHLDALVSENPDYGRSTAQESR